MADFYIQTSPEKIIVGSIGDIFFRNAEDFIFLPLRDGGWKRLNYKISDFYWEYKNPIYKNKIIDTIYPMECWEKSTGDNTKTGWIFLGPINPLVDAERSQPTPTPSPTPTQTPAPSQTQTPEITPTPSISQTPEVTVTPSPSITAEPTPTPSITLSPTPTATTTPNPTPTVTPTPSPTPLNLIDGFESSPTGSMMTSIPYSNDWTYDTSVIYYGNHFGMDTFSTYSTGSLTDLTDQSMWSLYDGRVGMYGEPIMTGIIYDMNGEIPTVIPYKSS